ncbi:hypothetical protein GALMADRAFT_1154653 [Galerina marginata CBS 339.88]|uniref:Uncharacterized protein n=1 Tax=Galerina marginata (strain CBS 339.88) TaxID=685588 RepID=A0A067S6S0_GALM3|nr:hypothetical protein GALMADRAFT_1154653 [Galerina marginata CBS 339.88]
MLLSARAWSFPLKNRLTYRGRQIDDRGCSLAIRQIIGWLSTIFRPKRGSDGKGKKILVFWADVDVGEEQEARNIGCGVEKKPRRTPAKRGGGHIRVT